MRQGQQNRRGRGRGGRKGQNPLSRSFESNGPDVKIRGTASHIAEKYMALARDAIGSGDLVLGENYLQHAEHYNRIIMAAQQQSQAAYDMNGNGMRMPRDGELAMNAEGQAGEGGFEGEDDLDGEQPGDMGQGFEQPRVYESQQGGGQGTHRGYQDRQDRRNYEGRNFEPRRVDQPRDRSFNSEQPRMYDQPRMPQGEGEGRPAQGPEGGRDQRGEGGRLSNMGPRGRRRRGRHENGGGGRPYGQGPHQQSQIDGPRDQGDAGPAPQREAQDDSSGGSAMRSESSGGGESGGADGSN